MTSNDGTALVPWRGTQALEAVAETDATALISRMTANALWPRDVTNPEQRMLVARVALAYGLDPIMGELTIYQGKPYVTIEGRLRLAHDSGEFRGIVDDRHATEGEYKAFRADPRIETLWLVSVQRAGWAAPTKAWGRVNMERDRSPVAQQHPALIARKRALWRALRDTWPLRMPGLNEAEGTSTDTGEAEMLPGMPAPVVSVEVPMATTKQLGVIHAISGKVGWTDAEYRDWLEKHWGVRSAKALTEFQAGDAIRALQESGQTLRPQVIEAACEAFGDFEVRGTTDGDGTQRITVNAEPIPAKAQPPASNETDELQQVRAEFMALFNECASLGLRPRTLSSLGKEPPISSIKAAISEMLDAKSAKA